MKAIVRDSYGSADVHQVREDDKPRPRQARCWYTWVGRAWTGVSGTS